MEGEVPEAQEPDSHSRRSSRKRRKINYKPSYDPSKRYMAQLPKSPENDKRRGRPKKNSCSSDQEIHIKKQKMAKKKKKLYCMEDIDTMIVDFIELSDKTSIQGLITKLQNGLKRSYKADTKVLEDENGIADNQDDKDVALQNGQCNGSVNVQQSPSTLPLIGSASTIPANLQTKSISVHGNNVIMQGVIDTGVAQQSCFLIPIDINNISTFPGSTVQVIHGPQGYMSNQPQLVAAPIVSHNQIATPIPAVNPNIQMMNQSVNYQPQLVSQHNGPAQIECVQNESFSEEPPISAEEGNSDTSQTITVDEPKANGPDMPVIDLNTKDSSSSESNTVLEDSNCGPDAKQSERKKPTSSSVVESLLEALQSSSSLPEILDQLSQEELVAIMDILSPFSSPNNSTSTVYSEEESSSSACSSSGVVTTQSVGTIMSTTEIPQLYPDLEKLAGELEQLSKMDVDKLPSGAVNYLANEISKVLLENSADHGMTSEHVSDHVTVGLDEEDEDFHHVQIQPQYKSEVTPSTSASIAPVTPVKDGGSFRCYICGLTCSEEKTFVSHMRVHLFKHRYSCYECGYGTSSMNELLLHKANDHEGDLTKISPDFLKQLPKLEKSSESSDLEDTLITCPECKQEIPLHSLGLHMTQAHKSVHKASPGRKPKCTICTALVDNKSELAAHVNHHASAERKFSCYFCSQSFQSIAALQVHTTNQHATLAARRHYKCTECSREFSGSYHLIRHIKTVHEQRRDYQCSKCDKSFVELHCLRRHIRNIHNMIRDHTCPVCNRGFTYRQDMFRHIMSVHQKIRDIKCPLCNEKFYHRYFIGHAHRQHSLKVKYRDGICYIYDDAGNVIHKIT